MSKVRTSTERSIYYDDVGDGLPILVLAGMTGDRRGSQTLLTETLRSHHRVVAMDLRDSGESDPEPDYYSMSDLAGDAADLLDALDIASGHVLGISLGGAVALQLCLDHPQRVDRLVLMSTFANGGTGHRAGDPPPPPVHFWTDDPVERVRRLLPFAVGPSYRDRLTDAELETFAQMERSNRATWESAMRQQATQSDLDLRRRLGDIASAALVIHGDVDPFVSLDRANMLASGIPNARMLALRGVGHLPWLEQRDVVESAILDFLAAD